MSKIPGKLKAEDYSQLIELVEDRTVLQLGCYCGRGLVALAGHARRVWVLDDFKYQDGIEGVVEELKANVNRHAPEDARIDLLYGTPEGWSVPFDSEDLESDKIEVVYRDADRRGQVEDIDQRLAMGLLKRCGGIYAWHDKNHNLKWLRVDPVPVEVN